MFIHPHQNNQFPTDKKDLLTEEQNRVYAVTASFLKDNEYIIQVTIGNYLPDYEDGTRLLKLFICNDESELQKSLAMLFQDRNMWASRVFQ